MMLSLDTAYRSFGGEVEASSTPTICGLPDFPPSPTLGDSSTPNEEGSIAQASCDGEEQEVAGVFMPSVFRVVVLALLVTLQFAVESAGAQTDATKRVALIVGNGSYRYVASLSNPPNDASDVGDAFRRVGFKVSRLMNADRLEFLRALRAFEDEALEADIAIVFYAGHGIEVDGSNFLIPIDAKL